jgi:hypothetical protein
LPTNRSRAARDQNIATGIARSQKENPAIQAFGKDPFVAYELASFGSGKESKENAQAEHAANTNKAQTEHNLRMQTAQSEHNTRAQTAQAEHARRVHDGMSEADSNARLQQEIANSSGVLQQARNRSSNTLQTDNAEADNTLQARLGTIGRAEQIGYTQGNRQMAFAVSGQMGGKGFKSAQQVRRAAASIAGGNNTTYRAMMGNFEHDVKGAGSAFLLSGDARQLAMSVPEQEFANWTTNDVRTNLASGDNVDHFLTHVESELTSTDPKRAQMALQMAAEFEDGRGMSPHGERINTMFSKPSFVENRQAAINRLGASIQAEEANAVNTRPVYGAVLRSVTDPATGITTQEPVRNPLTGRVEQEIKGSRKETADERISRLARKQRPDQYDTPPPQAPRP